MARVSFTPLLRRWFPELNEIEVDVESVLKAIEEIESLHSGFTDYILDEIGQIRPHVALFVDDVHIRSTEVVLTSNSHLAIMQSLSGG